MAQIADRTYLVKKNSWLFSAFGETRLPGSHAELDLLKRRMDQDLYAMAIDANISYIRNLVELCKDDYDCYIENLRRALD